MAKRNKYKKVSFKLQPISILVGLLIVAAIVVAIVLAVPSYAERIASEYSSSATTLGVTQEVEVGKDNRLKKVNIDQAIDIAKNNDVAIIYLGGTWSSTCVQYIGAVDDEFRKNYGTEDEPKVLADFAHNIFYVELTSDELEDAIEKLETELEIKLSDSKGTLPLVLSYVKKQFVGNINEQNGNTIRYKAKKLFEKTLEQVLAN